MLNDESNANILRDKIRKCVTAEHDRQQYNNEGVTYFNWDVDAMTETIAQLVWRGFIDEELIDDRYCNIDILIRTLAMGIERDWNTFVRKIRE